MKESSITLKINIFSMKYKKTSFDVKTNFKTLFLKTAYLQRNYVFFQTEIR